MVEISIFISSKMIELFEEREMLFDFIPTLGNDLVQFKPWLFEKDAPASDKSIREVYLEPLKNSGLYIGLFWNEYGEWTIDEFDKATEWNIPRHIYVKDVEVNNEGKKREKELAKFLEEHGDVEQGITAKWFKTEDELKAAIEQSINTWTYQHIIQRQGDLRARLFRKTDNFHELPEYFVGREKELQDSRDYLKDKNARVLIQGFGGEGKTALAAKAASDFINETASVLWLRLGSSSLDAAYEALAAPFNASQDMAKAQGDKKRDLLRALLKRENVGLVVLDDAWDNDVLQALSNAIPRAIPVIVTARNFYRVGKTIELGGLLPDAAFDLLNKLSDGVDDEDRAYDICEKLGYLAFAVEVAGRTMLENKWSTSDMLQRLQLSHTMEMPYEYRQSGRESVAVLLEQSILSLSDEAQKTFQALGAFFAPTITPELMALYQHPESEEPPISAVESTLDELQRRALVRYNPATDEAVAFYQAHDLSYSYASTQFSEKERNKALDSCLTYTKSYNEPSPENFKALEPEIDNFMGAATFAMQQERYGDVEKFAQDLYMNSQVLSYRGYFTQAIDLFRQVVETAKKVGNQRKQGASLGNLGIAYSNLGQYKTAIEYMEQVLTISYELGVKTMEANALGNLSNAYRMLGQYETAIEYMEQVLTISSELGVKTMKESALNTLGNTYSNLGQYKIAINYHQQSLIIVQEIGDKRGKGKTLNNLGLDYFFLGQYETAINYHQQSLAISQEIGDKPGEGNVLSNLGIAYHNLEQYERAIDYYKQALTISQAIGNKYAVSATLSNLGNLYDDLGQYERAIDYYKQALTISQVIGTRLGESDTLNNLGVVYGNMGNYDKAIASFEQALEIDKQLGDPNRIERRERNLEETKQKRDETKKGDS